MFQEWRQFCIPLGLKQAPDAGEEANHLQPQMVDIATAADQRQHNTIRGQMSCSCVAFARDDLPEHSLIIFQFGHLCPYRQDDISVVRLDHQWSEAI